MNFSPATVAAFCLVALAAGCGQPPPTFKVRGTATFQGKPVANGSVVFHQTETQAPPIKADVRPDGTFDLVAPAGDYKVTVAATTPGQGVEGVDRTYRPATLQTPVKYIRLDETPLKVTVQPGDDNAFTLSLNP